jgi:hypothetical protein
MAKRGRPKGHKLSEETKKQISKSKTGQKHLAETRQKIRESVTKYFSSPAGMAQRTKMRTAYTTFWDSPEGQELKTRIGNGLRQQYHALD